MAAVTPATEKKSASTEGPTQKPEKDIPVKEAAKKAIEGLRRVIAEEQNPEKRGAALVVLELLRLTLEHSPPFQRFG